MGVANVILQALLLFTAAFLGGAMNSVAGGGSFFSFPALLIVGLDAKVANATNTVALWPGTVASVGAYRRELEAQRSIIRLLAVVSLAGGLLGALLLLLTPSAVFRQLLPFLMLAATLLFAFSPRINRYIRSADVRRGSASYTRNRTLVLQLIISIYGGFFGGGLGILMLATLALMGMDHIHEMNAVKTLLTMLINGVAVVAFVIAGVVAWLPALLMAIGAIAGGYGGAALARRIQPRVVRAFVIIVGFSLSAYLFVR
jgi:hypothetical protein